jgi:hypothetical protein
VKSSFTGDDDDGGGGGCGGGGGGGDDDDDDDDNDNVDEVYTALVTWLGGDNVYGFEGFRAVHARPL